MQSHSILVGQETALYFIKILANKFYSAVIHTLDELLYFYANLNNSFTFLSDS